MLDLLTFYMFLGYTQQHNPHNYRWMVASISWIVVSSVVVLNLLIALMADSYSRIFESAELFARSVKLY